jgi:antitoxin (DNA-binding transcriptional repressor) of toxin-antitoxin stability system
MKTVSMQAARAQFSSQVEEAAAGNEIVIAKAGKAREMAAKAQ